MMEKKHNTKIIKTWEQPAGDLPGLPCQVKLYPMNHDIKILAGDGCKYDIEQKIRIMETRMSNDQAKDIVAMTYHPGLFYVCGIHISANANRPEYALQALEHGLPDGHRVQVSVAGRDGGNLALCAV